MIAHAPRIPFSLQALVAEAKRRARRRRAILAVAVLALGGGGAGVVAATHPFGWLQSAVGTADYQPGIVFNGLGGAAYMNVSAVLTGVSAGSHDAAWIVGEASSPGFGPLAWRWDRTAWRGVPMPLGRTAHMSSVAAVTPDDAWAVGAVGDGRWRPLIEHWDGVKWGDVAIPGVPEGRLTSVSAAGPSSVWALGTTARSSRAWMKTGDLLLLHWNGRAWVKQTVPWARPGDVGDNKVVATGRSGVWVVSVRDQSSVVEYWNGSRWRPVPSPFGPHDPLLGFSATAWNDAWAVGSWGVGNGEGNYSQPLAAHWNGSSWTFTAIPSLPGSNSAALESVVAVRPDDVWATGPSEHFVFGHDEIGAQGLQTLFLHWDGRSWKILPRTGRASVALSDGRAQMTSPVPAITAAPDGSVWAIGNCHGENLVLRWNGTEWKTVRHPRDEHWPPGAPHNIFRNSRLPSCPSGPIG